MNKGLKIVLIIFSVVAIIIGLLQLAFKTFVSDQVTTSVKQTLEVESGDSPLNFEDIDIDLLGSKVSIVDFTLDLNETGLQTLSGSKAVVDTDIKQLVGFISGTNNLSEVSLTVENGNLFLEESIPGLEFGHLEFLARLSNNAYSDITGDDFAPWAEGQSFEISADEVGISAEMMQKALGMGSGLPIDPIENAELEISLAGTGDSLSIEPGSFFESNILSGNITGDLAMNTVGEEPSPESIVLNLENLSGPLAEILGSEEMTLRIRNLDSANPEIELLPSL